jgi:hypothetical protein
MLDITASLFNPGNFNQRAPLAGGERNHHNPSAVASLEVVAECTVKVVAVFGLVPAAKLGFRDAAQIANHRKCHI